MKREYHRWFNNDLDRDMELLVFGHAGARVLVFPTSTGRFFEWEDNGMVEVLKEPLEKGWLQLFCVDSVDQESWYARDKHPHERGLRHDAYDLYLRYEVLPFTLHLNPDPYLIVVGASFGAYHAASFSLRYPDQVSRLLAMNGFYHLRWLGTADEEPNWPNGYSDRVVFQFDPFEFAGFVDADVARSIDIILTSGNKDRGSGNTRDFSERLERLGIPNRLIYSEGRTHNWESWRSLLTLHLTP